MQSVWRPKGLVGVIHLGAMPGDPFSPHSFSEVRDAAMHDADMFFRAGYRAVIVENFGSAPFAKGSDGHRIPQHQVAFLGVTCSDIKRAFPIGVGVNCLRNDAVSAIGIAAACDLDFIRVNVLSGAYVTDQGLIEGEAATVMRYRQQLHCHAFVMADVLVKHASPLAPLGAEQATEEVTKRAGAHAVIVSGEGTGHPVDAELLRRVARSSSAPVFIGSGLSLDNAAELAPLADGAIVGTSVKEEGDVSRPVDLHRARELLAACRFHQRS